MRHLEFYAKDHVPTLQSLADGYDGVPGISLAPLLPTIAARYVAFTAAAPDFQTLSATPISTIDKKMLIRAYDDRPALVRRMIEKMVSSLKAADSGVCPFCCDLGPAQELDHFMPKAKFPEFALFPANLVPVCSVCNKRKGQVVKKKGERVIVYPFEDLKTSPKFLRATVVLDRTARSIFSLIKPPHMTDKMFGVLERHFERLHLHQRLSQRANATLQSVVIALRGNDEKLIKRSLKRKFETAKIDSHVNSWGFALSESLYKQRVEISTWLQHN